MKQKKYIADFLLFTINKRRIVCFFMFILIFLTATIVSVMLFCNDYIDTPQEDREIWLQNYQKAIESEEKFIQDNPGMPQSMLDSANKKIAYYDYLISHDMIGYDNVILSPYAGLIFPLDGNISCRSMLYSSIFSIFSIIIFVYLTYKIFLSPYDAGMFKIILSTPITRKEYWTTCFLQWIKAIAIIYFIGTIFYVISFIGNQNSVSVIYLDGVWKGYSINGISIVKYIAACVNSMFLASLVLLIGTETKKPTYVSVLTVGLFVVEVIGCSFFGYSIGSFNISMLFPGVSALSVDLYEDVATYVILSIHTIITCVAICCSYKIFKKQDLV